MSGEDLYLIRTDKLVLRGPMSAASLRQKLKAMEFALSDEVAGNLSPWVKLEDLSAMKKYYPKLLMVLADDIPGAQKVINEATARLLEKKLDKGEGHSETNRSSIRRIKANFHDPGFGYHRLSISGRRFVSIS
jgi:hypothetical protein